MPKINVSKNVIPTIVSETIKLTHKTIIHKNKTETHAKISSLWPDLIGVFFLACDSF